MNLTIPLIPQGLDMLQSPLLETSWFYQRISNRSRQHNVTVKNTSLSWYFNDFTYLYHPKSLKNKSFYRNDDDTFADANIADLRDLREFLVVMETICNLYLSYD